MNLMEAFRPQADDASIRKELASEQTVKKETTEKRESKEPVSKRVEDAVQRASKGLAERQGRIEDTDAVIRRMEAEAKAANGRADFMAELTKDFVIPSGVVIDQQETKTRSRAA